MTQYIKQQPDCRYQLRLGDTEQVHELLKKDKIRAGVINCSSVKPLDEEMLKKIMETIPTVTLEEHMTTGGFGEYVTQRCRETGLKPPRACIGIPDSFLQHGNHSRLMEDAGLDPENPVLQLESRDLAWKDVARVQLWPEK